MHVPPRRNLGSQTGQEISITNETVLSSIQAFTKDCYERIHLRQGANIQANVNIPIRSVKVTLTEQGRRSIRCDVFGEEDGFPTFFIDEESGGTGAKRIFDLLDQQTSQNFL